MTTDAPTIAERINSGYWRDHPATMVRELFGVEPDAWQEEALEAFPHTRRLGMKACAGLGKAISNSTVIDTPHGPIVWGAISTSSLVFAEDGSVCRVVGVYPQGIKDIYRVTFEDGSHCDVTQDHLWKVRGRTERRQWSRRRKPGWTEKREARARAHLATMGLPIVGEDGYAVLSTAEIMARGVMTVNRSGPARQFEIPTQGAAQFPRASQPLDPYLVGVWIGDGTAGQPSYFKPYPEVEEEIRRRGYETRRSSDGLVRILGSIDDFRAALGDVFPRHSHKRSLPEQYRYASVQQRADLLCGLMDTDGCIGDDGHMEYDTTSRHLAEDMVWLVRSLGGVSCIKAAIKKGWYRDEGGNKVECRDCYRVSVTLPFNPFRIPHKRDRWHMPNRRYLTRYIASIEKIGREEATCIEVDHPSHCFLANDFIVTHNTAVLAWIGWNYLLTRPHPMIGCTSISGDNLKSALWTELARWRSKAPLLEAVFEQTKTEIFAREAPKTWRMEARTWAKDADADQIGNALAGIHAEYVMWLLDESGDYPDSIMPVCEGIFNGNPKEAHIVQAGNPTRLGGPLYRACTTARHLWKVIEITADPDDPKRTPRVSAEVAREQIAQYGADNPWVLVRIFGKFPPADFNALIGPDEVSAAMRRYYREHEIGNAALVLGVDVARFGDDQSIIFPRRGIQAFPIRALRNVDSTQGAGTLARMWDDQAADAVFIDNSGMGGGGWIDALIGMGKTPIGIDFGGSAHDKTRYANRRAEMYFDAVAWIKRGGALPDNPHLLAALTQTTYGFARNSSQMLLEPKESVKKKLNGHSPDEADAFVLTFAEPVSPKGLARPARQVHTDFNPFREQGIGALVAQSFDPYRER